MSAAARQFRRRRTLRALKESRKLPAEYVGHDPAFGEIWRRGKVLHVVPPIRDSMPAALKEAIVRRRTASLTGRCPCGARMRITSEHRAVCEHEADCTADNESLDRLLADWKRERRNT